GAVLLARGGGAARGAAALVAHPVAAQRDEHRALQCVDLLVAALYDGDQHDAAELDDSDLGDGRVVDPAQAPAAGASAAGLPDLARRRAVHRRARPSR